MIGLALFLNVRMLICAEGFRVRRAEPPDE
jgi:hypothetical protein